MITAQDLRRRLEAVARETMSDQWAVTRATIPTDTNTYTVQIGHVVLSDPASYAPGAIAAQLIVTLWVNEANDADATDELYNHLSRNDGSLYNAFCAMRGVSVQEVGNVGLRDWGPVGFTAGDIVLTIRGRS